MLKVLCILLAMSAPAAVQKPESARPDFTDYVVEKIYTGAPAPPKLDRDQRTFRTMIREGAKSKVEFAGHYTVPRWGCGSGCSTFVIVDSITGTVYNGFNVADFSLTWMEKHGEQERIEFHPNSRLIKINGCINEQNCGFYDYAMIEGKGLRPVRKELLPEAFQ